MAQNGTDTRRPNPTPFGVWLLKELQRRELTQADLTRKTGVATGMVSKWIYRPDKTPSPKSCDLIADALMLPVDVVLTAAGHRPPDQPPRGNVRQEAANLLDLIPEPLVAGLIPQLRGLANAAGQEQAIERIRKLFAAEDERNDDDDPADWDPEQAILAPGFRPQI